MEKNFYLLVSAVFHPIFIPLYIAALFFVSNIYPIYFLTGDQKLLLMLMLLLNTLVLPVLGIILMKRYRIISSYHIHERSERLYPYLYFFGLYVATAVMLMLNAAAPILLSYVYFVAAAMIFLLVMLNTFVKVSAHTSAIASFATILVMLDIRGIADFNVGIVIAIVLAGLVGTARLSLKAHTGTETALGYIAGAGVTLISSWLILF